jgi:hypothetical protein
MPNDEPHGHEDWDGEDTKNPKGHPPDKDDHPEIPDRDHDEEPPRRPGGKD